MSQTPEWELGIRKTKRSRRPEMLMSLEPQFQCHTCTWKRNTDISVNCGLLRFSLSYTQITNSGDTPFRIFINKCVLLFFINESMYGLWLGFLLNNAFLQLPPPHLIHSYNLLILHLAVNLSPTSLHPPGPGHHNPS